MIIIEAPNYQIVNSVVSNITTGKVIKVRISGNGYPIVTLRNNGAYVNLSMHRLVAKYELGIDAPVIEHKNDIKSDYHKDNLMGSTQTANITKALGVPIEGTKDGCTIKFKSCAEAARFVNKPFSSTNITQCCKGRGKTAFGYIWKYSKEEEAK